MKEVIMQVQLFSADYPKAPIYVGDLVRCKDCIYRQTYICPMYREEWHTIEAGDGYFVDDDLVVFDYTVDDGYCYLGERKNNAIEKSEVEE